MSKRQENTKRTVSADNRILYTFAEHSFTVSEVESIYSDCYKAIKDIRNELHPLFDFFKIKPKNSMHYCREEVVLYLAEYIAILAKTVEGYGLEIKRARRKFIYWGDLNPILYSINEELLFTKTDRILKDEVVRNRELYMHLIAYACYKSILDGDKNIQSQIEDDALCKHKIDYDYVDALKYFSSSYSVNEYLQLDIKAIFSDIYQDIEDFGVMEFYSELIKCLSDSYDADEHRIMVSNSVNTALPTLYHLSIKALSKGKHGVGELRSVELVDTVQMAGWQEDEDKKSVNHNISKLDKNERVILQFEEIVRKTKKAVVLLDVDNELDIGLLLPVSPHDSISGYLKHLIF